MRALVLGGQGLLGREFAAQLRRRGDAVLALGQDDADLADRGRLLAWAHDFRPEWVVNCAAYTLVDDCERERDLALAVNGEYVAHVAAAADAVGAGLLHFSTDYVFDGATSTPYREDHPRRPLSVYGASKALGEERALAARRPLVLRTSWLFGCGGPNFVAAILAKLAAGERRLRVVADQVGAPTAAPALVRAALALAESGAHGVWHYRDREPVSWYEFARAIVRAAGFAAEVEAIATSEYSRPAPRPAYSVLEVARTEQRLGRPVEPWSCGLEEYLATWRSTWRLA